MPVPTDQLAADIRDSNHRLAESFNELSRRIEATEGESNRRLTDAVQEFGRRFESGEAKLTEFRLELADKLSSINTNLQVFQTRTEIGEAKFTEFRSEIVDKLSSINTNLQVFQTRTEIGEAKLTEFQLDIVDKLSSINTNLQVFQTRTEHSISVARWAIGIAVPILLGLIGFSFSMAWHAAKLDLLVKQHDDSIRADRATDEAIAKSLDVLVKKLTP